MMEMSVRASKEIAVEKRRWTLVRIIKEDQKESLNLKEGYKAPKTNNLIRL